MVSNHEDQLIQNLPGSSIKEQLLVYKLLPEALSGVPFHRDTAAITRYVAKGFPFHLAVHEVSTVLRPPAIYTEPHSHFGHDELNLIVSDKKLVYKIQLGEEVFTVRNNASIWIPRGMLHAANVLEGSGFFVTIRL